MTHLVVVGASLAGLRAVEAVRGDGFDGTVTLVGAEEHLPYDRPPLSKEYLAAEVVYAVTHEGARHLDREPRLADPARPDERDQSHVGALEQLGVERPDPAQDGRGRAAGELLVDDRAGDGGEDALGRLGPEPVGAHAGGQRA